MPVTPPPYPEPVAPKEERPHRRLFLQPVEGELIVYLPDEPLKADAEHGGRRLLRIPLDKTLNPTLALEEAVYDHPFLLGEFAQVDILLPSGRFMAVPEGVDGDSAELLARDAGLFAPSGLPAEKEASPAHTLFMDKVGSVDAPLALMWTPEDSAAQIFMGRTWANPRFRHLLTPLVDFFTRRAAAHASAPEAIAHLRDTGGPPGTMALDLICITAEGELNLVNSFTCSAPDDAVYYILAGCRAAGINPHGQGELRLCGDGRLCSLLLPRLSTMAPSASSDPVTAAAAEIPLPLYLSALCE